MYGTRNAMRELAKYSGDATVLDYLVPEEIQAL